MDSGSRLQTAARERPRAANIPEVLGELLLAVLATRARSLIKAASKVTARQIPGLCCALPRQVGWVVGWWQIHGIWGNGRCLVLGVW